MLKIIILLYYELSTCRKPGKFAYQADDVYWNVYICLFVTTKETSFRGVDGPADLGAGLFWQYGDEGSNPIKPEVVDKLGS